MRSNGYSMLCPLHTDTGSCYDCAADITFGKACLSDETCQVALKRWACRGVLTVDPDSEICKEEHKRLGPARKHINKLFSASERAALLDTGLFTSTDLDGL